MNSNEVNFFLTAQSIKFISNQIKKLDIQCTPYNIHAKLFYNKNVTTLNL